jgi:serine/threonine protein kinase
MQAFLEEPFSMARGLIYLSGKHVIYQDIKLENLWLEPLVNLKLLTLAGPASSTGLCECMITNVDIWNLGILYYEFFYVVTPFEVTSTQKHTKE